MIKFKTGKMEKNISWELVRNHFSDLLSQDLILGGFYKYCDMSKYGAPFKIPFVKYDHKTGDIFWAKQHMDALRNLHISDDNLDKLLFDIENEIKKYKKYIKVFKKQLNSSVGKVSVIKKWFDKSQKVVPLIAYFVFEESLVKELEAEGYSVNSIPSARTDVTDASEKISVLKKRFQKEIESGNKMSLELRDEINKIIKRYSYLGMKYFSGYPWTIDEVYQMVKTSYSEGIHSSKKFSKILKRSRPVKYLSELLRLRTVKWEMMCFSIAMFREYIVRFFSDKVRYEDLLSLKVDEVIKLLEGSSNQDNSDRKNFVLSIDQNGYHFKLAETTIKTKAVNNEIYEIFGTVAYAGKITGVVKIIFSPKDSYKINKGDILVATMSTPDFLPAMQRSAAFVTDIGGITSHAAIVAREMKKPCIIGTKIATKVLKDGDLVEVDAERGVVKILKRK